MVNRYNSEPEQDRRGPSAWQPPAPARQPAGRQGGYASRPLPPPATPEQFRAPDRYRDTGRREYPPAPQQGFPRYDAAQQPSSHRQHGPNFGQAERAYQQQPPPAAPFQPQPPGPRAAPPKGNAAKGCAILGCGGVAAVFILVAILVNSSSSDSSSPPAASQPAAPAQTQAAAAPDTVTYVVTGSDADVTYGPSGSNQAGSVPLNQTADIPSDPPLYYAVQAQLQGGGTVSCQIEVDGTVISSSTASGGYNIAQCEIGQDPLTGNWEDDN
jgi:hypothetical protein